MPPSPPASRFEGDWAVPLHSDVWLGSRVVAAPDEVDCSRGIVPDWNSEKWGAGMETAKEDFEAFLQGAGLMLPQGRALRILKAEMPRPEEHRVTFDEDCVFVRAGNAEGVRRALIWIEDEMQRRGGPFLPVAGTHRWSRFRTRIGGWDAPIYCDPGTSLMHPAMLQRLVHSGANAIFAGVQNLNLLVANSAVPELASVNGGLVDRFRRLGALCRGHGIKLYLYAVEPQGFPADHPVVEKHPELVGRMMDGSYCFRASSPKALDFVRDRARELFESLPDMGGLITICAGEKLTHCLSSGILETDRICENCTCDFSRPHEILAGVVNAFAEGVHLANPEADSIAWPYMQSIAWGEEATLEFAGRVPPGVILMHNFEHGGRTEQKTNRYAVADYWISYPGPSELFSECAHRAAQNNTEMFAKIMVGASHELASVGHIPVPSLIYQKYVAMAKLGIAGVLQCWSSGEYPSFMTRAAGELSFGGAEWTEDEFLHRLALRDWGPLAVHIVEIWKIFADAFTRLPLTIAFSYYGPLHDGLTWPLHLFSRNASLPRNWMPREAPGDRIGECFGYHPENDIIELMVEARDRWEDGMERLRSLPLSGPKQRILEGEAAQAESISAQLHSACNILSFYQLRSALNEGGNPEVRLERMAGLVREEIELTRRIIPLFESFPRLGFCTEAEEYKIHPAKLEWRASLLEGMLREEFSLAREKLSQAHKLCDWSRESPQAVIEAYFVPKAQEWRCGLRRQLAENPHVFGGENLNGRTTNWTALYDCDWLYLGFESTILDPRELMARGKDRGVVALDDCVWFTWESSPCHPVLKWRINAEGAREHLQSKGMNVYTFDETVDRPSYSKRDEFYLWEAFTEAAKDGWRGFVRIPFRTIPGWHRGQKLWRVNAGRAAGPFAGRLKAAWNAPHGSDMDSPQSMGWLRFMESIYAN